MITYSELQEIFLKATYLLRDYTLEDFENPSSKAQRLIRLAYQKDSQPFQKISEAVTYVWVNYSDSPTNKITNTSELDYGQYSILDKKSQLRTIDVHWISYGDSAHDLMFNLRQKLLSYKLKNFLDEYNIKLIPTIPEIVLIYEEINGRNWPRVEYTVSYYLTTEFDEEIDTFGTINLNVSVE